MLKIQKGVPSGSAFSNFGFLFSNLFGACFSDPYVETYLTRPGRYRDETSHSIRIYFSSLIFCCTDAITVTGVFIILHLTVFSRI